MNQIPLPETIVAWGHCAWAAIGVIATGMGVQLNQDGDPYDDAYLKAALEWIKQGRTFDYSPTPDTSFKLAPFIVGNAWSDEEYRRRKVTESLLIQRIKFQDPYAAEFGFKAQLSGSKVVPHALIVKDNIPAIYVPLRLANDYIYEWVCYFDGDTRRVSMLV